MKKAEKHSYKFKLNTKYSFNSLIDIYTFHDSRNSKENVLKWEEGLKLPECLNSCEKIDNLLKILRPCKRLYTNNIYEIWLYFRPLTSFQLATVFHCLQHFAKSLKSEESFMLEDIKTL